MVKLLLGGTKWEYAATKNTLCTLLSGTKIPLQSHLGRMHFSCTLSVFSHALLEVFNLHTCSAS